MVLKLKLPKMTKNVLLNSNSLMKKKSERFGWFLTLKIHFESPILALCSNKGKASRLSVDGPLQYSKIYRNVSVPLKSAEILSDKCRKTNGAWTWFVMLQWHNEPLFKFSLHKWGLGVNWPQKPMHQTPTYHITI